MDIDIRILDEWIYALNEAAAELEGGSESGKLLQNVMDQMRERRERLRLIRHNVKGY